VGPPIFEWLWAKLLRKKLIYDFDDSIWIPNTSEGNSLAAQFKCFWKVAKICGWAWKVSVGNAFLAEFAGKFNTQVVFNPTCVDTLRKYNSTVVHKEGTVVVGWTGSHSTLPFLETLSPVLNKLATHVKFTFLVICDREPDFPLPNMKFIRWNKHTEIEDLLRIDIGIMPLKNDVWAKGKCGFKIIQYMALGIPAVATKVGVNDTIIDEGENGYTCTTEAEWMIALTDLISDANKREQMGAIGRSKIKRVYSIQANSAVFLSLFDIVCTPSQFPVHESKV
ncbi:MAG: glycosyltransferase, partial [Chitinophagaceae bacterium]